MKESDENQKLFDELAFYTLAHGDPAFIHQYVVDAFAAWSADENTRGITISFALIGLYLHVERRFTGREVQREHMRLARRRREWPTFRLPAERGHITPAYVLDAQPGSARDNAIDAWCRSVWTAYADVRPQVIALYESECN